VNEHPPDFSPEEHLTLILLVLRGGSPPVDELCADFVAWVEKHGFPTHEMVQWWFDTPEVQKQYRLMAPVAKKVADAAQN
jgi:hypothetical protein